MTRLPAWQSLADHYDKIKDVHLRALFAGDESRGERFTVEDTGLYLDYSKNRITDETLGLLLELARATGLRERIDAMFGGDRINVTEGRPVLHVALRAPRGPKHPGGRPGRGARRARRTGPDVGLCRPGPLR